MNNRTGQWQQSPRMILGLLRHGLVALMTFALCALLSLPSEAETICIFIPPSGDPQCVDVPVP